MTLKNELKALREDLILIALEMDKHKKTLFLVLILVVAVVVWGILWTFAIK